MADAKAQNKSEFLILLGKTDKVSVINPSRKEQSHLPRSGFMSGMKRSRNSSKWICPNFSVVMIKH